MTRQIFVLSAAALLAQAGFAQMGLTIVDREAPVTPVPYERILNAAKEPQNWLTYSGNYNSQRYSGLTQITPSNAKDLTLKWVFQSRTSLYSRFGLAL